MFSSGDEKVIIDGEEGAKWSGQCKMEVLKRVLIC